MALALPGAALASGSLICTGPGGGLVLTAVLSRSVGPQIVQATLHADAPTGAGAPIIVQSWIDDTEIRLDLADAEMAGYVARLRVPRMGTSAPDHGSLVIGDRLIPVACTVDG